MQRPKLHRTAVSYLKQPGGSAHLHIFTLLAETLELGLNQDGCSLAVRELNHRPGDIGATALK